MKTNLLFALIFISFTAIAQTRITGTVVDSNGEFIPGANILLVGSYDGTSSDASGRFTFSTEERGPFVLNIRFVGYKEFTREIILEGKDISVAVVLEEEINQLEAVTITAGAFTAGDESRRTILKAVDIATTAGATADIAGALNTLPGTQKVGESGRLFVRGGDGNETRTFIDGMVVLDAYSNSAPNTPSRGRFLPFMFKGTSFSTGGYSAEYGQALSSALVLDSKDEAGSSRTDIGLLSVGADVAHTHAWDRGSVAGKVQYTNIRPYFGLINQEIDWVTPPASLQASGAFRQKISKTGIIKFYGNFNQASYSLFNHSIDDDNIKMLYELTNKYRYMNGFFKNSLNENWIIRGGLSYTYNENDVQVDGHPSGNTEKGVHAKAVLEGSLTNTIELKAGAEAIQRNYTQAFPQVARYRDGFGFDEWIGSAFAEAEMYTSNKFVARAGGRIEYNNLISSVSIDPRLSLAYKLDKHGQFSLAYGRFRQAPAANFVLVNRKLASEQAQHFILNYQRVENNRTFRVETYYKKYEGLVKVNGQNYNNDGNGYGKGFEIFWRDNQSVRRLDYWVSYSFLDTERDYINYPYPATPVFASRHNFSMVGKYFVTSWKSQIGATYSYTSGRPYNNPNAETFNGSRTPYYQDVSFNWSYLPKPSLIIYLSCTNLLGRDNVFGYEYGGTPNAAGFYNSRPIRQPAPRFLFVGIFLTISKEKSMNQLPAL
jgi:CarboxypepD_reg-like domain/TonB-dependent Receptor Plug Domain